MVLSHQSTSLRNLTPALLAVLLLVTAIPAMAEEQPSDLDPLLVLLIEKGLITEEEARAVQQERRVLEEAAEEVAPAGEPAGETTPPAAADHAPAELPKSIKGLSIGTLAYLSYQGMGGANDSSRFTLKRSYLNIRKKITPHFEARITPDVHQDSSGDWKVRCKYLYAKPHWQGNDVISKPYLEVGLAHMPWLDFEEHINRFRMQDTMFMERNGLFNSADGGIMFGADLGGQLSEEYRHTVNNSYAGRYGSFQLGLYNGGGYHAPEKNSNKVVQGRITLRPLPDIVPGFQVSLFALDGKGNVADDHGAVVPDWQVRAVMLSYESRLLAATAQYYEGEGNQKGTAVDAGGWALEQDGYSLFAELRCPHHEQYSLIARNDSFDTNTADPASDIRERWIAGIAWQFCRGNYLLLDYDHLEHSLPGVASEDRLQLTLQVEY